MKQKIASEFVAYIEENKLLLSRQFGNRKGHSVEDQLLFVYSEVATFVDRSYVVDLVLLDFSKAFDVVSHVLLLQKLRNIGVCSSLLSWIWGFLSNRKMCVSVGKVCSSSRNVLSGVPQGSVLRPILFLVYVNFLTECIKSNFEAFAVDFKIYMCYQCADYLGLGRMQALKERACIPHTHFVLRHFCLICTESEFLEKNSKFWRIFESFPFPQF